MKVAIVHDYLKEFGGAERVVDALVEAFPGAVVYTAIFMPRFAGPNRKIVERWNVKTSFLQYIPFKGKLLSPFRFIAPWIFKAMDLSKYEVVIVSAAGTYVNPNFIRVGKKTLHICYCHTPPRYLYGYPTANPWNSVLWRRVLKFFGQVPMHFMRLWDFKSAQLPDYFVVNSKEVAARVEKFYRRDSTVIYPPVDIGKGLEASKKYKKENFYLAGGRLSRHKGMDLAVRAATKLKLPLKVFGAGFASYGERDLKALAGKNVEFLGEITDEQKWELMAKAKAFIFPSEQEDFGITPVEAMSAGTPVIALGQGGVLETVIDGRTGVLFDKRDVKSLLGAIEKFKRLDIKKEDCIKQARKFSKERFNKEIKNFLNSKIKNTN
jgi:glycosyltransferase involved in cell wall biosynthesis